MKANELRIGNYLLDENSNVKQVVKIGFTRVWIGKVDEYWEAVDYNETSSIPLTEEWLLKFGFRKHSFGYFEKGVLFLFKEDRCFSFAPSTKDDEDYFRVEIKYVHQLQNLYFALTGEELTLKEN